MVRTLCSHAFDISAVSTVEAARWVRRRPWRPWLRILIIAHQRPRSARGGRSRAPPAAGIDRAGRHLVAQRLPRWSGVRDWDAGTRRRGGGVVLPIRCTAVGLSGPGESAEDPRAHPPERVLAPFAVPEPAVASPAPGGGRSAPGRPHHTGTRTAQTTSCSPSAPPRSSSTASGVRPRCAVPRYAAPLCAALSCAAPRCAAPHYAALSCAALRCAELTATTACASLRTLFQP